MSPWAQESLHPVSLHGAQVRGRRQARSGSPVPQRAAQGAHSPTARSHLRAHHEAGALEHRQAARRVPRQEALAAGAHQHHLPRVLQQEAVAARHVAGRCGSRGDPGMRPRDARLRRRWAAGTRAAPGRRAGRGALAAAALRSRAGTRACPRRPREQYRQRAE